MGAPIMSASIFSMLAVMARAKSESGPEADAASACSEAGQRKHATAAQVASGFIYFLELLRDSSNTPSLT
jgi:hypothetical protein